jgi:SRSO17 transposase
VAADSVYGVGEIETALRRAGKGYVLGVNGNHPVNAWGDKPLVAGTADEIAQALPASAWARLSAGAGTKGARLHDWAYLELADLAAAEYDDRRTGLGTRGLLVRRSIADGALAFFSTWCPAGTSVGTLVSVEGHRGAIEDGFETAKTELGLDHNETRSPRAPPGARPCGDGAGACCAGWHGWHRHVSLVILAFAMLATIRHHANQPTPPKTLLKLTRTRPASSAGRSRKSAASPSASPSDASDPPASAPGRTGDAPTKPAHNARI